MPGTMKWLAALAAALLAGVYLGHAWSAPQAHDEGGDEAESGEALGVELTRNALGDPVLRLTPETAEYIDLEAAPLTATTRQLEQVAYGMLMTDPSQTFVVRAPFAGLVRASLSTWPKPGQSLGDGIQIGGIEPRLGPVERADLSSQLTNARAEIDEVTAELAAARASYESKKKLNEENKIVSDRALEEALAKVKSGEARLKAARDHTTLIQSMLASIGQPTAYLALVVERGGQVIDVLAQPGEAVESGQPILSVARFEHMLARVQLPAGTSLMGALKSARIIAAGFEDHPIQVTADAITLGEGAGRMTLGTTLTIRVDAGGLSLRPAMPVTAYLELSEQGQPGLLIPTEAVIQVAGLPWVYVETGEDEYTRKTVLAGQSTPHGWFVGTGFEARQRVVTRSAQILLSQEMKFQTAGEEEE